MAEPEQTRIPLFVSGSASVSEALELLGMKRRSENPCLLVYGPGPEGATCKTCRKLIRREWSKRYYKCPLRRVTRGPATDHRVGWPACGKYEPDDEGDSA